MKADGEADEHLPDLGPSHVTPFLAAVFELHEDTREVVVELRWKTTSALRERVKWSRLLSIPRRDASRSPCTYGRPDPETVKHALALSLPDRLSWTTRMPHSLSIETTPTN